MPSPSDARRREEDSCVEDSLIAPPGEIVEIDVSWLAPIDLAAVDLLVRLHLAATRRGYTVRFHGGGAGLVELLELMGLTDVLRVDDSAARTQAAQWQ